MMNRLMASALTCCTEDDTGLQLTCLVRSGAVEMEGIVLT